MKRFLMAVSVTALMAGQVTAGGLEEPVVQAVEEVEQERTSAAWIIPLVAIALVALAVSSGDDDDDDDDDDEEEEQVCGVNVDCVIDDNNPPDADG
ncbi:MAG: hypothetical protein AAFR98_13400 [Pseudomonadota bacterium]